MNAGELLDGLAAFSNTQDAGADGNGILSSRLVNGVEYARSDAVDEARPAVAHRRGRTQGGGVYAEHWLVGT